MTPIFTVAVAVIALHVVDDNFLQPNAGTSAGDHLVSGLVPLAMLALLAFLYPRLRAGAQATTALILGPLGLVAGAEAIRSLGSTGLNGDDYTGMLALVAGAVLIGLGLVTLWRSRHVDDRLWRRYARRAGFAALAYMIAMQVVMPLMLSYGYTHVSRPLEQVKDLGIPHERLTLTTDDGLKLAAMYVPSRNGAAVIAFPNRNGVQDHARMLARNGYGVLMLDRRGEGGSEGDPHSFGWTFDKDLDAAIDYLSRRPDVEPGRIGGYGKSVGGEMMLQVAAQDSRLAAVVSEGAGARMQSEEMDDAPEFQRWFNRVHYEVKYRSLEVFSNASQPDDLTDLIPRIAPRPVFLINAAHGEVDDKTPEYLASAEGPVRHWEVPKGNHTDGIDVMPEEYERRVVGFFDETL
jgi:fermentation-respiration switch protein FrsA (DUF1100 family)